MRSGTKILSRASLYAAPKSKPTTKWRVLGEPVLTIKQERAELLATMREAAKQARKQNRKQRKAAKCAELTCAPVPLVLRKLSAPEPKPPMVPLAYRDRAGKAVKN